MRVAAAIVMSMAILAVPILAQKYSCLRKDIELTRVVQQTSSTSSRPVSVAEKLKELKARCRRGRLVDRRGRQISFYELQGCWGNPPADYRQVLEKQRKEVAVLRRKFTVVEFACDQGVSPRSIP